MTKSMSYKSMQSNVLKMRQSAESGQLSKQKNFVQTNWIYKYICCWFFSLMHCVYHRFYLKYLSIHPIILTLIMMIVLIISILYGKYDMIHLDFLQIFQSQYNESSYPNYRNIDKELFNKLLQIQSNIKEKVELIENDIETVKLQQKENNEHDLYNQYKNSLVLLEEELKQEIYSLSHIETNVETDIMTKFNILKQEIKNIEQKSTGFNEEELQKTIDILDTFMMRQNEINQQLFKLIDSNKQNRIIMDESDYEDRADFAVSVEYHTEIMTSSLIENIQMKIYYFLTRKYDQNAVRPTLRSGDCTPLKFNVDTQNYIILKLRERIFINGITIEYINPNLLQNDTKSAPKNMSLELSKDGYHYYQDVFVNNNYYLIYNPFNDGIKKYFQFDRETTEKYKFAKLNIISNYGAKYSCLYRIQIHGHSK